MKRSTVIAAGCLLCAAPALCASAQTVKVTPLGGIDGEFCPQDRALVFEDPNGTRILYDPGRTVAGPNDPRLGKIDIILVSHTHGDHVGNAHNKAPNIGDNFTTGPVEAAYVINELVKPAAVIPSHANEVGTVNGKVRAGSKTEAFIRAVKVPVHVALSGKTMEFEATGKCTAGC